jgi:hypothetical protein
MGQDLPSFADAEEVMCTLLSNIGPPVVKGTSSQLSPPVIVVRRMGGHSDYVTDFPQVLVVALGSTRPASMALQLQCQRTIENAFCTEVILSDNSVVLIDGTATLTSGHPETYENIDIREVAAVYELRMRRPIIVAH